MEQKQYISIRWFSLPQSIITLPHSILQAASNPNPFFDIFAAERKKHMTRAHKLPVFQKFDPVTTSSTSAPA
jgi:hypothetical protein